MNPHSLYDLGAEYNETMRQIEEADGELTPELEARHDEIVARLSTSAANVAAALDMCDGAVKELEQWIEKLDRRRRAIDKEAERWKQAAISNMAGMGINELSGFANGLEIKLRVRESESVAVDVSPEQLPDRFVNTKVTKSPDKKALKEALAAGDELASRVAHIERKPFLVVRS